MHFCWAAIYGEEGNDALEGGASRDWIHGGPGNDRIEGWSERDFLWGDEGNDIITGGLDDGVGLDGRDIIWGGPGDDRIDGWKGNDEIHGNAGNDEIYGGKGSDYLFGGAGHDNLFGEEDYDYVYGDDGDDLLYGGPGPDFIGDWSGTNFVLDDEYWWPDPPPVWPDDLPWPELNLVADVTADVIVDDGGPGWASTWSYEGSGVPQPPTAGYWYVDDLQSPAFGGAQSYLYAHDVTPGDPPEEDPLGDAFGDGRCESMWYLPVWTEQGDVFVTWDPRPDATTAAPFEVRTLSGQLLPPSPMTLNQTLRPDQQQGFESEIIGGRVYTKLGTFDVMDGWLVVNLSDLGVPVGTCIVADAVVVKPVYDAQNPIENQPGSWANREENGFYGGLLINLNDPNGPMRKVKLRVEDILVGDPPHNSLTGQQVKLEWEGGASVIKVFLDEAKQVQISSGYTWTITDPFDPITLYVEGQDAGSTELLLSLLNPPTGRPISDTLAIRVGP